MPILKEIICLFFFKNECIPFLSFPVPFPWTILTYCKLAKKQSSINLSTSGIASSTESPITFISEETVRVLEI